MTTHHPAAPDFYGSPSSSGDRPQWWHHQVLQITLGCGAGRASQQHLCSRAWHKGFQGCHQSSEICWFSSGIRARQKRPYRLSPALFSPLFSPDLLDFYDQDDDLDLICENMKKQGLQLTEAAKKQLLLHKSFGCPNHLLSFDPPKHLLCFDTQTTLSALMPLTPCCSLDSPAPLLGLFSQ